MIQHLGEQQYLERLLAAPGETCGSLVKPLSSQQLRLEHVWAFVLKSPKDLTRLQPLFLLASEAAVGLSSLEWPMQLLRASHAFGPGGLWGEGPWGAAYPLHEGNFH